MRPDYDVKKTVWKGAKGLLLGAVGVAGAALLSFVGDGPALTAILLDADMSPLLVGAVVSFITGLTEFLRNVIKQRK